MEAPSRPKLGRFFFLSFIIFCGLLPLWGQVSPVYTRILAKMAQPFLLAVKGEQSGIFVLRSKETAIFVIDARTARAETLDHTSSAKFETNQVHRNVPLLLALFLATPGLLRGRHMKALVIAFGVLFVWHAGYVTFVIHRLAAQMALAAEVAAQSGAARAPVQTRLPFEVFLRLFIPQLLPFVLWAGLVHFRHPTSLASAPASVVTAGRNDPCPCGSGKKYKRCCGMITTVPV
jgi:hypothetical protein